MKEIRVLLVDDHAVLRTGLKTLLSAEPDLDVVGEAADGAEALRLARALAPDVVLMDITMPGMDGLTATRQLREHCPQTRIVVLTMHEEEGFLRRVLAVGGAGYVLKTAAEAELLAAIRAVHRGEAFVDPSMTRLLIQGYLGKAEPSDAPASEVELSPREQEILALIAAGYANQQIAGKLFISVKTVETHKAHIKEKLGAKSRIELVQYALDKGLLKRP